MIKLVLFDFDDTLCLTEEACFHLENHAASLLGFPPMSRETHKSNWGHVLHEAVLERFPGINVDDFLASISGLVSDYVKEGKMDAVSHENLAVLSALKEAGRKIGILTSRSTFEVDHLLIDDHPFTSLIDVFYHKDNLDFLKPDPRVFDKAIADFQLKPDEIAYVGDSVSDAIASNKAGLHFIAVMESGLREKEAFKDHRVDFFAPKFTDTLTHLLEH